MKQTIAKLISTIKSANQNDRQAVIDAGQAMKKFHYPDEAAIPFPIPTWEEYQKLKDGLTTWTDSYFTGTTINFGSAARDYLELKNRKAAGETDQPTQEELDSAARKVVNEIDRLIHLSSNEKTAKIKGKPGRRGYPGKVLDYA